MIVTINTDASYHPRYKVGAYSFWIVCDQGKMMQSGGLKQVKDSQDSEMKSITNALYALLKSNFTDVKYVIINTDCTYAIDALKEKKKGRIGDRVDVVKKCDSIIGKLRKKYDIGPIKHRQKPFISWRYVKAHTEGDDARTWVNNWCDKAAKKSLWELINKNNERQILQPAKS